MSSDTAGNPLRVVLDTNVIISALIYGGKPEQVYNLVLEKKIIALISSILLSELTETLVKKFKFENERIKQLENIAKKSFRIMHPKKTINILKDDDDNRVLEAAIEGKCDVIITGDRELLELASYRNIKILTSEQFLTERYTK